MSTWHNYVAIHVKYKNASFYVDTSYVCYYLAILYYDIIAKWLICILCLIVVIISCVCTYMSCWIVYVHHKNHLDHQSNHLHIASVVVK